MQQHQQRRFQDRVWIEREVLGAVNRRLAPNALNGLSDAAIEAWRADLGRLPESEERIVAMVLEIARRAKLHVDTSRDVFDDEGIPELSTIERLVVDLKAAAMANHRMQAIRPSVETLPD
jgi:hypothetical protein